MVPGIYNDIYSVYSYNSIIVPRKTLYIHICIYICIYIYAFYPKAYSPTRQQVRSYLYLIYEGTKAQRDGMFHPRSHS